MKELRAAVPHSGSGSATVANGGHFHCCDMFDLTDIMQFRYNWNREILAQFHVTYFYDEDQDVVHWMTDKTHYRISFLTFCQIFGFNSTHRGFRRIHANKAYEIEDVKTLWRANKADGKKSGLKGYYYVMNNLIRNTIDPKDGAASDINGYVRNVLIRMPDGERFNVPRFIWVQLSLALKSGRRNLPYAPYIMFMIERVTGRIFPKDCIHTQYDISKAKPLASTREAAARETVGGSSRGGRDILESSHRRSSSNSGFKGKVKAWMRAIFGHCSYGSQMAYDTRMEMRESLRGVREREGLPPLAPIPLPPQYDLPQLSGSSSSISSGWFEQHQQQYQQHQQYQQPPTEVPRRSSRFTSTTHQAGRAVILSDDDEATSGPARRDDINWDDLTRSYDD